MARPDRGIGQRLLKNWPKTGCPRRPRKRLRLAVKRANNGAMSGANRAGEQKPTRKRIEAIDAARGVALIAMAIYHFTWDLEFFGYAEAGTTTIGGWKIFARGIASSFLVLVGVSLFLAHGRGIRWRPFLIRLAMVAGAALAISGATWFATPSSMIFFGILHEIALASLLGLAFLRLPALVTLAAAVLVIVAPSFARSSFFDHPAWLWLGLSSADPRSNDYVPIFPWFGAVLTGIAFARLAQSAGLFARLAEVKLPRTQPLQFIGRHSLAFYLIHQPVLIGAVWSFAQLYPAPALSPEVQFRDACEAQCTAVRDETFCARYCVCMLDEIEGQGLAGAVFEDEPSDALSERLQNLASTCTQRTDVEMEGAP